MPARPIILSPDPRLKTPCDPVREISENIREIIADLWDTMDSAPPRTVGIAAPQVGIMLRIALVDVSRNPKYPAGHGPLTLINPNIIAQSGTQTFREGCLSIPDFTANVERFEFVRITALDIYGRVFQYDSIGFESVVLQHEIDHLDGLLFLDKVRDIKTNLFRRRPHRAEG